MPAKVVPELARGASMPLHRNSLTGALPVSLPPELMDVDEQWLTTILREQGIVPADVHVQKVQRMKAGPAEGFTSMVCKLKLTYSGPVSDSCPTTMIAKISGGAAGSVSGKLESYILHNIFYPNEIRFYVGVEEWEKKCPAKIPKCFFAASRGKLHTMLLEDMSYGVFGTDRNATKEQASAAMVWFGRLHRTFWNSKGKADTPANIQNFFCASDWHLFPFVLKLKMPKGTGTLKFFPESEAILTPVLKVLQSRWKQVARFLKDKKVQTLTHGDPHLDNFVFHEGEAIGIDFGNCGWTHPALDISYFLCKALDRERQLEWQDDLIDIYYSTLTETGQVKKTDFDKEACKYSVKIYSLAPMFVTMTSLMVHSKAVEEKSGMFSSNPTEDEKEKLKDLEGGLSRVAQYVNDSGLLEQLLEHFPSPDIQWPLGCVCCWAI